MAEIMFRVVLTLSGIASFGIMYVAAYGLLSLAIAPGKYWSAEADISSRITNGFMGVIALITTFVFGVGLCDILFNWQSVLEFLQRGL